MKFLILGLLLGTSLTLVIQNFARRPDSVTSSILIGLFTSLLAQAYLIWRLL